MQKSVGSLTKMSASLKAFESININVTGAGESMAQLTNSLVSFSNVDESKIAKISRTFANISKISNGDKDKVSRSLTWLTSLVDKLEHLKNSDNVIKIDFKGVDSINALKPNKAALYNLATYLPLIGGKDTNVTAIKNIAAIDWTKTLALNNLHVDSNSVKNLANLAGISKDLDVLKQKIKEIEKANEEAAKAAKNASANANDANTIPGEKINSSTVTNMLNQQSNAMGELSGKTTQYGADLQTVTGIMGKFTSASNNLRETIRLQADDSGKLAITGKTVSETIETNYQRTQRLAAETERVSKAYSKYVSILSTVASMRNKLEKGGDKTSSEYKNAEEMLKRIEFNALKTVSSYQGTEGEKTGYNTSINMLNSDMTLVNKSINDHIIVCNKAKLTQDELEKSSDRLAAAEARMKQQLEAIAKGREDLSKSGAAWDSSFSKLATSEFDEQEAKVRMLTAAYNGSKEAAKAFNTSMDDVGNSTARTSQRIAQLANSQGDYEKKAQAIIQIKKDLFAPTQKLDTAGRYDEDKNKDLANQYDELVERINATVEARELLEDSLQRGLITEQQYKTQKDGIGLSVKSLTADINNYVTAVNKANAAEAKTSATNANAAAKSKAEQGEQLKKSLEEASQMIVKIKEMQESIGDASGVNGGKNIEYYKQLVNDLKSYEDELNKLKSDLAEGKISQEVFTKSFDDLSEKTKAAKDGVKQYNKEIKDATSYEKQRESLLGSVQDHLRKSTAAENSKNAASRDAYQVLKQQEVALKELNTQYLNGDISIEKYGASLDEIRAKVKSSVGDIKQAGDYTKTLGERFAGLAQKFSMWFGASQAVMQIVNSIREMISTAIELDSAMTQLKIVTDESDATYVKFADDISNTAQQLGVATKDLIDATTTYSRLGYTLDESSKMAELTTKLQTTGKIESQDAQDAVTAMVKAFKIGTDDLETVMDKLVAVGNGAPISVSQIAEAMNNASSILSSAGNTIEQSIALMTAANTTIELCRAA